MGSLIKCKGCGESISKKAKECPQCGEPAPKKTSVVTWMALIVFILFIIGSIANKSDAGKTISPKEQAKKLVTMVKYNWSKGALGAVLTADFTIKNASSSTIKDIEITCIHYAKSGTKIDSNSRTIYDIVKTNSTKTFKNFNMGFINSQANKSNCSIMDFEILE